MKNKELRVAVYMRWDEGHSFGSNHDQVSDMRGYVESKGWRVAEGGMFVDANVPPIYECQTSLQAFVKQAEGFDVLVVKNIDALGTHSMSVFPLITRLKIMGVDIHYSESGKYEEKQALTLMYLAAKSALEAPEDELPLPSKEAF